VLQHQFAALGQRHAVALREHARGVLEQVRQQLPEILRPAAQIAADRNMQLFMRGPKPQQFERFRIGQRLRRDFQLLVVHGAPLLPSNNAKVDPVLVRVAAGPGSIQAHVAASALVRMQTAFPGPPDTSTLIVPPARCGYMLESGPWHRLQAAPGCGNGAARRRPMPPPSLPDTSPVLRGILSGGTGWRQTPARILRWHRRVHTSLNCDQPRAIPASHDSRSPPCAGPRPPCPCWPSPLPPAPAATASSPPSLPRERRNRRAPMPWRPERPCSRATGRSGRWTCTWSASI